MFQIAVLGTSWSPSIKQFIDAFLSDKAGQAGPVRAFANPLDAAIHGKVKTTIEFAIDDNEKTEILRKALDRYYTMDVSVIIVCSDYKS